MTKNNFLIPPLLALLLAAAFSSAFIFIAKKYHTIPFIVSSILFFFLLHTGINAYLITRKNSYDVTTALLGSFIVRLLASALFFLVSQFLFNLPAKEKVILFITHYALFTITEIKFLIKTKVN